MVGGGRPPASRGSVDVAPARTRATLRAPCPRRFQAWGRYTLLDSRRRPRWRPAPRSWLLTRPEQPTCARIAGEASGLITGLDLAYLDRLRTPAGAGPNDDPNDNSVTIHEDDCLARPDAANLRAWWRTHQQQFKPGARYFLRQPVLARHCMAGLKAGFQRQSIAVAPQLCLLHPGTLLFNCATLAWRQQRLLAAIA